MDNRPLSEQHYEAFKIWVDLDAAASILEATKQAVLSQKMLQLGGIPVNRAKLLTEGSELWAQYVTKIVETRQRANHAKARVEYLKMRFQEWISEDANNRQAARI